MDILLDETKREQCSIEELVRIICGYLKTECDRHYIGLVHLQYQLCPNSEKDDGSYIRKNKSFLFKFYEAIGRLKQRGLLMEANKWCCEDYSPSVDGGVRLTAVGEESDFDDGILILVDDAYEIVQSLKDKAHNLDSVVEQYYLESLRTCQNGNYISSVICLGAAAERTINCLADTVVQCYPQSEKGIEDNRRYISRLTEYLVNHRKELFVSLEPKMQNELTENLEGLADIYRKNRNAAGHPKDVPQDWDRCEQECYLSQFRRLALTCFKAIGVLNS